MTLSVSRRKAHWLECADRCDGDEGALLRGRFPGAGRKKYARYFQQLDALTGHYINSFGIPSPEYWTR